MNAPTPDRREEIGNIAERLYEDKLRHEVETPDNIGKMLIIDVRSGDFAIDTSGLLAARKLYAKRANAELFGIRIGFVAANAIGGAMERRPR